jgi:hypothetical protein
MDTKSPGLKDLDADGFLLKLLLRPETTKHEYDQVCSLFRELDFVDGDVAPNGPFMKLHEPMVSAKTVNCLCQLTTDAEENVIGLHVVNEGSGESVWLLYSSDWVGVPVVLASYGSEGDVYCCKGLDQEKRYLCQQIYIDDEAFEVFEGLLPLEVVPIQAYQIVADLLADIIGEDIDWENWEEN